MATRAPRARALHSERLFYFGMATAILVTIFAGFAPSFYLRGVLTPYAPIRAMSPLVLLHGLLFTGWVMLFAVQAGLISAGRVDLHRKLGVLGFFMVAAMIVVGTLAALHGVARHSGPPDVAPLVWLAVPLVDVPVFGGLIGAALYNRRRPQTHKRLMLIATIGMLMPATGRLPWPASVPFPVIILLTYGLFLTPLVLWDVASTGRVQRATIGGSAYLLGSWALRLGVWQTAAWLAFAGWAASLVN